MDNKEEKSIHEFDVNLICEYFLGVERQGPGSPEMTRKALSFIDSLNEKSRITDLGCGTGGQTMVIAQNTLTWMPILNRHPRTTVRSRNRNI
jgi:hypothetical protein